MNFKTLLTVSVFLSIHMGCASTPPAAKAIPPLPIRPSESVVDIPRVRDVAIDGDSTDWKDAGLAIEVLHVSPAGSRHLSLGDAWVRFGWDDRGLIALVTVRTSEFSSASHVPPWKGVTTDLFVGIGKGRDRDVVQAVLAPVMNKQDAVVRPVMRENRATQALRAVPLSAEAAVAPSAEASYVMEVLIPWPQLGVAPKTGDEIAVQAAITSTGKDGDRERLIWYPIDGAHYDKGRMQRVRLTDQPGAHIRATATGTIQRFRRIVIDVAAENEHAGQSFDLRDGDRTIGRGTLTSTGRLATSQLTIPMPSIGEDYQPLEIVSGGKRLSIVELEDINRARRKAFAESPISINGAVFLGKVLPKAEFDNPSFVEDAVGQYELKTTYYDSAYNVVTRAGAPGRYGVIVEATSSVGGTIRREFTLFKHEKPLNWRNLKLDGALQLPSELGLDPLVVREQTPTIVDMLSRELRSGFARSHEIAIAFAGLAELPKSGAPVPLRLGVRQRNADWWYELRRRRGETVPYSYVIKVPTETPADGSGKWPVMVFLHGLGERGDDLERLSVSGPLKELKDGRSLPFVVVAPQCPDNEWWNSRKLNDMLDEVVKRTDIDTSRIYLTGLSMGGFGSWAWAVDRPDRFAAVAPICGGGDPLDVERIKDLSIWVFHGDKDTTVLPDESYQMVDALRKVHARVRFTLYPTAGHDSWTETYANAKLYEWMLAQRLGQPAQPRATVSGTQPSE